MYKFKYIFGGIVFTIFGCMVIIKPIFYDHVYGLYLDFTKTKWPFGGSLIIIGILLIWSALNKKAKSFEGEFLICPKCETTFNRREIIDQNCPQCNVKLEDLEGFYDRHPEKN